MHLPSSSEDPKHAETARQTMAMDAAAGAVAGGIARFIIGPLDVLKIRFQVQLEPIQAAQQQQQQQQLGLARPKGKYTGLLQAVSSIIKDEGIQVRRHAAVGLYAWSLHGMAWQHAYLTNYPTMFTHHAGFLMRCYGCDPVLDFF